MQWCFLQVLLAAGPPLDPTQLCPRPRVAGLNHQMLARLAHTDLCCVAAAEASRRGLGAAMLRKPRSLAKLAHGMAVGSPLPVTVKVRKRQSLTADVCSRECAGRCSCDDDEGRVACMWRWGPGALYCLNIGLASNALCARNKTSIWYHTVCVHVHVGLSGTAAGETQQAHTRFKTRWGHVLGAHICVCVLRQVRVGESDRKVNIERVARLCERAGVAGLIVHGRTAEQR